MELENGKRDRENRVHIERKKEIENKRDATQCSSEPPLSHPLGPGNPVSTIFESQSLRLPAGNVGSGREGGGSGRDGGEGGERSVG